jgi:large subunit ribosomal protein L28e
LTKKAATQTPAKHIATTEFKYQGVRRIAKTVNGLAKNGYRPELKTAALAKTSALIKSQKNAAPVKTGRVNLKTGKPTKKSKK